MSLGTNPVQELAVNKIPFSNALVTDVEFENGKHTQIITIFNNSEFHFEEMKRGIDTGLNRLRKNYPIKIKSIQTTFNSIKEAKLQPFSIFQKQEFNNKEEF